MTQDNRYRVIDETLAKVPNPAGDALPPVNREQATAVRNAIVRRFFEPKGLRVPWGWDGTGTAPRRVWLSKLPTHPGNHDKGLGRLVHDLSHALFESTYRGQRRAHDPLHVKYEQDIAEFVATSKRVYAILHPKPKAAPPKIEGDELRRLKLERLEANYQRWHRKKTRAENAMAKIRRQQRGLMRALNKGATTDDNDEG